ncbi:MAG: translocation/assembly module TamB domain-containing protein [Bordetella sp.]|nr:MAG: translocation/assembly module TamB domain-containing protein [Bordetella sp.]
MESNIISADVILTPINDIKSEVKVYFNIPVFPNSLITNKISFAIFFNDQKLFKLDKNYPIFIQTDAEIHDLDWLNSLFETDLKFNGIFKIHIRSQKFKNNYWNTQGIIEGKQISIIQIEEGIRLINGNLLANINNEKLTIESFHFPTVLKFIPSNSKVREWVDKKLDIQNGYAKIAGSFYLNTGKGEFKIFMNQFPIIQRPDRYIISSGKIITSLSNLTDIKIDGQLIANTGLVNIEYVPQILDDDVIQTGNSIAIKKTSISALKKIKLKFDTGYYFRLTGLGLDTGLIGSITFNLKEENKALISSGVLHTTSDGTIEAYGQRLKLRHGQLFFQGSLNNPHLDIEALRVGEQIEAGIHIQKTAQRPKISLISYPNVNDLEKLSWLILGRESDDIADKALLISIGNALLNGKLQLFKQLGLSDIRARKGDIGGNWSGYYQIKRQQAFLARIILIM